MGDCKKPEADTEWVLFYHASLLQELVQCNVANDLHAAAEILPLARFEKEYRWAFLDLCRVAIASHWPPGKMLHTLRQREAQPEKQKLVYNAYNKSVQVALWMLERMRMYLDLY